MTALLILIAAFIAVTAAILWADATGFDPWAWLYGSDLTPPPEVQDWRAANYLPTDDGGE